MKNLIELFPKSIFVQDNVCVEYLDKFEETIYSLKENTKKWNLLNVNTSHSTISKLNQIEPFNLLEKEILRYAKQYMTVYGYNPTRIEECYIREMWFNISNKNDFLFPHDHKGSLISGAFYIKAQEENSIFFHDDNKNFYEDAFSLTRLSTTLESFDCIPGRLILFHSNFLHSTPPQKSEGDKIVVSFNLCLENKND